MERKIVIGESAQKACKEIITHYGLPKQLDIVVEECSELIKAICKAKRSYEPDKVCITTDMLEEIVDVQIMLTQLIQVMSPLEYDYLYGQIDYKLKRQTERIRQDEGGHIW